MSEPIRRARALSAALLAAVFAAGVLVGAATHQAMAGGESRDRHGRHGFEAEVFARLNLEDQQKQQVETIMKRRRAQAAVVWSEVKPRLNEVVAQTRADLSRVLRPEQLAEYDRLMTERSRRMERRFESDTHKGGS
jgi:Spy/CpxP family protein refolding chaperone